MKIKSCGWRTPASSLGQRSWGQFAPRWHHKLKTRMVGEGTSGIYDYMEHITNEASFEAFRRKESDPLLSIEALPENSSFLNFSAFAKDFPENFFALVSHLRPEFQELCIEYYVLHKSQAFLGKAHGFIQTRTWQNLRILEQAIGALILLGTDPSEFVLRPILAKAGLETTSHGSLTAMIVLYAKRRDYACVAKAFGAPAPSIRKIFRPIINKLLADKDVNAVAVGAYLRSLTHQASLSHAGLSKSSQSRLRRVRSMRFSAPPSENSPLISFGATAALKENPWCMLEISSEHRMSQIRPLILAQGKRIFKKKPAQVFAPLTADGELAFGYIFARSTSVSLIRALTRIRGISEISAIYNDEGAFQHAVTVPNSEVQSMIESHHVEEPLPVKLNNFVRIETGPAIHYCGTVIEVNAKSVVVEVKFPTGRRFLVSAAPSSVTLLPSAPVHHRMFWGIN